ncbi:MAG TPA: hypothetical protein VFZ66_29795 [Herpetosiphonaceae bacterium]
MPESDYISGEEAAALIGVSKRTVERWATDATKNLHVSHAPGGKQLYLRADVERLADEYQAGEAARARAAQFSPQTKAQAEIMSEATIQHIADLERQLFAASHEIGRLTGVLEQQRLLTDDALDARRQLADAEARAGHLEQEAERLREELEQARRPWYKRLFGG